MLLRTIALTALMSSTITCGDELLDLGEEQMRIIAAQLRSVRDGAAQCKETARQVTHAVVHMSDDEIDQVDELFCVSLPDELVCRAEYCTCSSSGGMDNDGNYSARCDHTKEGKTTSKDFEFSTQAIATFTAPTDSASPEPEIATAPEPTVTSEPVTPTPSPQGTVQGTDSQCADDEAETLNFGEQVLGLATTAPLLVSNLVIAGITCSSEENGTLRTLQCESDTCECTATFRLNSVPQSANCTVL